MKSKKEIFDGVKIYLLTHFEQYKKYVWMYYIDLRYNLNLSIKERHLCDVAHKLLRAYEKKKERIKRMLDYIIMQNRKTGLVWFCTFTFEDVYINMAHKDVVNIFKGLDWCILNEDFGKTTHRRHYHAIIGGLEESALRKLWPYGFVKFKRIYFNLESYNKVCAYIVKLSAHAIKKEVARCLYYSKNLKKFNR